MPILNLYLLPCGLQEQISKKTHNTNTHAPFNPPTNKKQKQT